MLQDLILPRPNWPGLKEVKAAAAKVGRGYRKPADERAKLEAGLRAELDKLDDHALMLWANVAMIDHRFCGATGTGAYWAVASRAVNDAAQAILEDRDSKYLDLAA